MLTEAGGRKTLAEMVYDRLFRAIKSGAYADGERLPTEHDLAAEFEVSRPVVREALRRLRERGLIYSRRGAGSFVRQAGLREPLGFGPLTSVADLERCYEFRMTIEPEAAAAACRAQGAALARIEAALELLRDATARARHREDTDFAFHAAIAKASENRYFAIAMEALADHIAVGMRFHGQSLKQTPHGLSQVYEEHARISAAIRDGRPEAARAGMLGHLRGSRSRVFEGRGPAGDQKAAR